MHLLVADVSAMPESTLEGYAGATHLIDELDGDPVAPPNDRLDTRAPSEHPNAHAVDEVV